MASGLIFFNLWIPFQASSAAFPEEGRVIRFIVPNPPGGGMDLYPRTLMPFLKKHLPWKKGEIVVDNVIGAGGFTGSREIYYSKPDGYTLGIVMLRLVVIPQLLGQVAYFDSSRYSFFGQFNNFPAIVFTSSKHPFLKTFSDVKNPPRTLTYAMDMELLSNYWLFKEKMKLDVKPILGFKGTKESQMALIQGEVDITTGEYGAITALRKSGEIRPLIHLGEKPLSMAPEIPSLKEVGYEEYGGVLAMDRLIIGPPDIPKDRVEILRKAIWEAFNDPKFIEWGEKSERYLDVQNGETARQVSLRLVNFWTKHADELKQTMAEAGLH